MEVDDVSGAIPWKNRPQNLSEGDDECGLVWGAFKTSCDICQVDRWINGLGIYQHMIDHIDVNRSTQGECTE